MKGIKEAMQKLSDESLGRSWKESIDQSLKGILDIKFWTHRGFTKKLDAESIAGVWPTFPTKRPRGPTPSPAPLLRCYNATIVNPEPLLPTNRASNRTSATIECPPAFHDNNPSPMGIHPSCKPASHPYVHKPLQTNHQNNQRTQAPAHHRFAAPQLKIRQKSLASPTQNNLEPLVSSPAHEPLGSAAICGHFCPLTCGYSYRVEMQTIPKEIHTAKKKMFKTLWSGCNRRVGEEWSQQSSFAIFLYQLCPPLKTASQTSRSASSSAEIRGASLLLERCLKEVHREEKPTTKVLLFFLVCLVASATKKKGDQ